MNESIWLKTLELDEIRNIYQHCLAEFGIIQCLENLRGLETTISFMKEFGFRNTYAARIRNTDSQIKPRRALREMLSLLYTKSGKLKAHISEKSRKEAEHFRTVMRSVFAEEKEYLTGAIMVFEKQAT
ncbi:MAG: hypothetical protein AAGJ93_08655 [Bacteroidota bacterium]